MATDIEKIEQIQNVITGRSIFEKTYTYNDLELEVNVKLHYPTMREMARVQAETSNIFLSTIRNVVLVTTS